ncbi:hypothetical protein HK102_002861 [Quaeritorhiza haematococci]|nr:hypothetical protein HK102_002861 [Quaeritorhiza haematococci]
MPSDSQSYFPHPQHHQSLSLSSTSPGASSTHPTPGTRRYHAQHDMSFFCSLSPHLTSVSDYTLVQQAWNGRFDIWVHAGEDIVSDNIKKLGVWDDLKASKIVEYLGFVAKVRGTSGVRRVSMAEERKGDGSSAFIDVGAHIGWFSFAAASSGHTVFAFEPMVLNEVAFRKTSCENAPRRWNTSQIGFYRLGLGSEPSTCILFSGVDNKGDGHLHCTTTDVESDRFTIPEGYAEMERLEVVRLDDVQDAMFGEVEIGVMKTDTEGFEYHVFSGGTSFLLQQKIPYIITEFSPAMLRGKNSDPLSFLHLLQDTLGYEIWLHDFTGKRLFAEEFAAYIEEIDSNGSIPDLWLTHSDWLRMVRGWVQGDGRGVYQKLVPMDD